MASTEAAPIEVPSTGVTSTTDSKKVPTGSKLDTDPMTGQGGWEDGKVGATIAKLAQAAIDWAKEMDADLDDCMSKWRNDLCDEYPDKHVIVFCNTTSEFFFTNSTHYRKDFSEWWVLGEPYYAVVFDSGQWCTSDMGDTRYFTRDEDDWLYKDGERITFSKRAGPVPAQNYYENSWRDGHQDFNWLRDELFYDTYRIWTDAYWIESDYDDGTCIYAYGKAFSDY